MQAESPRAALLDEDGELDDLRRLLDEIGVAHCDAHRAAVGERVPLLLSSTRGARALAAGKAEAPPRTLHAVIASEPAELSTPGDLLLLRPIEAAVLRLLTRPSHRLGLERRLSTRVALGVPVKISVGDDRREVIVSRVSIGGCGLIGPAPLRAGARVRIDLPDELSAPRHLVLHGEVLSARQVTTSDGHTYDVSVAFDELDIVDRVTLRALMARHAIDFRPSTEGISGRGDRGLRRRATFAGGDRRRTVRRRFQRRVMGVCEGIAHVLMSRDLSVEGLRIEPADGLAPGDDLVLAVFGEVGTVPLITEAVLDRCDESDGLFVRFAALAPEDAKRLDALIELLPPLDLDSPRD